MNQEAILQSTLLDIIFENRNKDYGAYKLRRFYRRRLKAALSLTIFLAGIVSLIVFRFSSTISDPIKPAVFIPGVKISEFHIQTPPPAEKKLARHENVKNSEHVESTPVIVALAKINNLPATPQAPLASFNEINPSISPDFDGHGSDGGKGNIVAPVSKLTEPEKIVPVEIADIMPQYPGGMKALLSFLRKNLHAPKDLEEGEEITVKIKFVVDYNGNLAGFTVDKSGGDIFDKEVIRVLNAMPAWIPGKTKGKNVSVYYVVPVKFTSE